MKNIFLFCLISFLTLSAQAATYAFRINPSLIASDGDALSVRVGDSLVRIQVSVDGGLYTTLSFLEEAQFTLVRPALADAPTIYQLSPIYFKGTKVGTYPGYTASGTYMGQPVSFGFSVSVKAGVLKSIATITPSFSGEVGSIINLKVELRDFYNNVISPLLSSAIFSESLNRGSFATVVNDTINNYVSVNYTLPAQPSASLSIQAKSSANPAFITMMSGSAYCSLSKHEEGGLCIDNTRSCSIANGSGSESWSGSWNGCIAQSCNSGYHIESNACFSDSRSCSIANGSGSQSWSGSSYGSCIAQSCNSGYLLQSGSCNFITYTAQCSNPINDLQICDGTLSRPKIMSGCINDLTNASASLSSCSDSCSSQQVQLQSPAGSVNNSIEGGFKIMNCAQGSSSQTFGSITCNVSHYVAIGQSCLYITNSEPAGTCAAGTHLEGASCISDSRACDPSSYTAAIIGGLQSWSSSWGACIPQQASHCASGYVYASNNCSQPPQSAYLFDLIGENRTSWYGGVLDIHYSLFTEYIKFTLTQRSSIESIEIYYNQYGSYGQLSLRILNSIVPQLTWEANIAPILPYVVAQSAPLGFENVPVNAVWPNSSFNLSDYSLNKFNFSNTILEAGVYYISLNKSQWPSYRIFLPNIYTDQSSYHYWTYSPELSWHMVFQNWTAPLFRIKGQPAP